MYTSTLCVGSKVLTLESYFQVDHVCRLAFVFLGWSSLFLIQCWRSFCWNHVATVKPFNFFLLVSRCRHPLKVQDAQGLHGHVCDYHYGQSGEYYLVERYVGDGGCCVISHWQIFRSSWSSKAHTTLENCDRGYLTPRSPTGCSGWGFTCCHEHCESSIGCKWSI